MKEPPLEPHVHYDSSDSGVIDLHAFLPCADVAGRRCGAVRFCQSSATRQEEASEGTIVKVRSLHLRFFTAWSSNYVGGFISASVSAGPSWSVRIQS